MMCFEHLVQHKAFDVVADESKQIIRSSEIISSKKKRSLLTSVPRPDSGVDEPDEEKAPGANPPLGCIHVSEGHKLPQSSESKHGLFFQFCFFFKEGIILKYLLCSHDVACFFHSAL